LVEKSSGYFIFAATVVKFLDDKQFRPVERLDDILGSRACTCVSPFDTLDHLYRQILSGVPIYYRSQLLEILTVIRAGLALVISQIEQLLRLELGQIRLILRGLHSVLKLPKGDKKIIVHHASFLDFLDDRSRSG
ncbi:hypothetical protein B0H14DRAFT_2178219, partial [Mycena olivaceomarginata]